MKNVPTTAHLLGCKAPEERRHGVEVPRRRPGQPENDVLLQISKTGDFDGGPEVFKSGPSWAGLGWAGLNPTDIS